MEPVEPVLLTTALIDQQVKFEKHHGSVILFIELQIAQPSIKGLCKQDLKIFAFHL